MKKKIIIIAIVVALFFAYAVHHSKSMEKLVYSENLDKKAVTVDGEELTLRNLAFYIAYEEKTVEDQAVIYSPDNTNAYWNLHIDGKFVKIAARDAALDMAVHDRIFYREALTEGLELDAEEKSTFESSEQDFWADLSEEQRQMLGVSEEDIYDTLYQMTLAQKYQSELAAKNGKDYAVYDIAGTAYAKIKEEHRIKINKSVWERIDFGNITISHQTGE